MKKIVLFLVLICTGALPGLSQEIPVARISPDGLLTLPSDQELSDEYQIDCTALTFASAEEMENFFAHLSDGASHITVSFEDKTASLRLKNEMLRQAGMDWGAEEWNNHFAELHENLKYIQP